MKKADAAWLAGIIDGEGSIMIQPHYARCRSVNVVVTVGMTHRATVGRIKKIAGAGRIQMVAGYKECWGW